MAIVGSDLTAQWSTRYDTLFRTEYNQSLQMELARIAALTLDIPLGDFQGNQVQLDWLGAAPQMREWVDEKRDQGIGKNTWSVIVKRYEASTAIDLDTFKDARGNVYDARIQEMAQNGARLRYNLLSELVSGGAAAACYDGQYFFDTDHVERESGTQSNKLSGAGTSVANIETDFYKAKSALMGFKDDKGIPMSPTDFRPLVWIPNVAAIIQGFRTLQGATIISNTNNILANSFELVIDPRLTGNDWYMFRPGDPMKPFIVVPREEPHYEDNFDSKSDDVFKRRIGMASVVGRMAATYGLWQKAVMIDN